MRTSFQFHKVKGGIPHKRRILWDFSFYTLYGFVLFLASFVSCASNQAAVETPLPSEVPVTVTPVPAPPSGSGGIVDEIRFLTEKGTPTSLAGGLEIIRGRDLGSTEFGRVMITVSAALLKTIYPSTLAQIPATDPPLTHAYSKILREAERGVYTSPLPASTDYLEHVLPFLSIYPGTKPISQELYDSVVDDLEKAAGLNSESALAPYFLGILYENTGSDEEAYSRYSAVWEKFPDCFPAAQGIARVMGKQGREEEAVRFLQDLVILFPDNIEIKRQLALGYYHTGDWSRAGAAVAEILQRNSRDGEFVLMRAHIMIEEGQFIQAQAPLDIYATINPNDRLYLFLRARVQAEGYHNRDAALNYLRSILRSSRSGNVSAPDEEGWQEASVYAARLLMESTRPEDQSEGRGILQRLLESPSPSLDVAGLALEDAIRRENWTEAETYLSKLLEERRSSRDLMAAYTVEKARGNNAAALSYARELYERDRSSEDGISAYISALIDTGRNDEASRMIESRLNGVPGGVIKSDYYYLRSRIRNGEEAVMNDLRSSLFEDPRNLDALIAMFEIYHRRRDERRAVYYLKQALALAPENPRLKRYEMEYSSALGSSF